MREILFKANRLDNGEWVEGYLFETREHAYIAYANQFDDDLFLSPQNIFIEVDANTICQYTGRTDKNGNKIWDNDVVECKSKIYHFLSQIKWDTLSGGFLLQDSAISAVGLDAITEHGIYSDVQVIGNIFDNSEFLKGGGEDEID